MFEMKNEADETATNTRTRTSSGNWTRTGAEKKCEYAMLVSLLEADSELYNNGIVDVFIQIRKDVRHPPAVFIPIITLLRNAALGS